MRKYNIDLLRIVCAIAVVIIHVISLPVDYAGDLINENLRTALNGIHALMNWSVPVFFMITGYCILQKEECTYKYCFSHVTKYASVLLTVGLFYALLEEIFNTETINIEVVLQAFRNVISGNSWTHMWYVYTIIGIYLVLPVIYLFMQQGKNNVIILTVLLFLFSILIPSLEPWVTVGIPFPFEGYLFYVCFGGAICKCNVGKKAKLFFCLLGIISFMWILMNPNNSFEYNSLPVSVIACCIFLIASEIKIKPQKLVLEISRCTWGIYLIHPLFINIAVKVLHIDFLSKMPYIKLMFFLVVVFVLSLFTTFILRKIPLLKKLF